MTSQTTSRSRSAITWILGVLLGVIFLGIGIRQANRNYGNHSILQRDWLGTMVSAMLQARLDTTGGTAHPCPTMDL